MSSTTELLVLAFGQENKAGEVLKAMQRMIDVGQISVLDAALLVKSKDGRTIVKDIRDVNPVRGALFGAISGGLIGLVGGPVGAVLGAVAGATTGGVAAYAIDLGFSADYLKELQTNLQPGNSALIILSRQEWSERIIGALAEFGGRVLRHALKEEIAAYLAAIGALDSDTTPATELPARLERQIAAWQANIESLVSQVATNGATQTETKTQLINLRTMQRLAQEKLCDLLSAEVQAWTEKIEALQAKAETAPELSRAEILAELEATRTRRRVAREKLYNQTEMRVKGWQAEIKEMRARLAEIHPGIRAPESPREAGLRLFISTFDEPILPVEEVEAHARIADLHARINAAEAELQHQQETQIAVWQTAIKDMQAYLATSGVPDRAAVADRIEEVQAQIKQAQSRLKTQLDAQVSYWQAEIKDLQTQVALAEAAGRARINERILALQAEIKDLQAQADAATAADQARADGHIAALRAKIAEAQARLQTLA